MPPVIIRFALGEAHRTFHYSAIAGWILLGISESFRHDIMAIQSFCNSSPWVPTNLRKIGDAQFTDFVEGLGPAQMVGRQVLGKFLSNFSLLLTTRKLESKTTLRIYIEFLQGMYWNYF